MYPSCTPQKKTCICFKEILPQLNSSTFLWQFLITSYPSLQFEEGYHIGSGTEHVEILDFRVFGEETAAGKDMEGQRKNASQN